MSATSSHPSTGTNTQDIDLSRLRWIVEGCKYFKETEELVVEYCRAQGHGRADIYFNPWVVELRAFYLAFNYYLKHGLSSGHPGAQDLCPLRAHNTFVTQTPAERDPDDIEPWEGNEARGLIDKLWQSLSGCSSCPQQDDA